MELALPGEVQILGQDPGERGEVGSSSGCWGLLETRRLSTGLFRLVSRKKFQKKGVSQSFSKAARLKWQSLERRIIGIVMQRMTIVNLEADMERLIKVSHGPWAWSAPAQVPCVPQPWPFWLCSCVLLRNPDGQMKVGDRAGQHPTAIALSPQKREELFLLQEALRRKRERLQAESPEEEKGLQELAEEIEVLAANIDYINDSITDCQATIVQLEETKVPARTCRDSTGGAGWCRAPP